MHAPTADAAALAPPRAARPRGGVPLELPLVFGAWTLIGVLFGGTMYFRAELGGEPISVGRATVMAAVDVYTWALITLAALWATRRFPLERARLSRGVVAHTLLGLGLVTVRALAIHSFFQATGWFPPRTVEQALYAYVPVNFVSYWLVAGAAHALEYARRLREREVAAAQLEGQLTLAQLQMLKMQLHPHFLFNTLHAISSLVHRDPDAAERMIASLSELLRTTLAHQQAQEVTVAEELDLLEPYLSIEKTRLGDRLRLDLRVEPEARGALVPHLMLQPLVENAIRHGIAPRRQGGTVRVSVARAGDDLRVRVEDDGAGFAADRGEARQGGVGLTNTRARLAQLYGPRHRLSIDSVPGRGARVEISLPFRPGEPAAQPMAAD